MIIYKATNKNTNKVYIGQTVKSLEARVSNHFARARSNESRKTHFHNSILKHGEQAFVFEIIDRATSLEELNRKEEHWIAKYDSTNLGYNLALGGEVNAMDSPKVKERHLSRMQSPEVRASISKTMAELRAEQGFSKETRDRISEGLRLAHAEGRLKISPKMAQYQPLAAASRRIAVTVTLKDGTTKDFGMVKDGAVWLNNHLGLNFNPKTIMRQMKKSHDEGTEYYGTKWTYNKDN